MLKVTFLREYINVVVYKCDVEQSVFEFAKSIDAYSRNILCESENLKVGDYLVVDFKKDNIHIVKPAETLRSISQKYNISIEELKTKNKCERVFIGQQIYL